MNKTISISYELNEKLRKEENASNLITRLLENHFKITKIDNKEETLAEFDNKIKEFIEKQEKEKMEFIEYCNKEKELKTKQLSEIERIEKDSKAVKEQEEIEIQTIKEKRVEEFRKKAFFNLTGRDMTDEEYKEFINMNPRITIDKYAKEKS